MENKRRDVALFRYSLIRELADPKLSPRQRGALISALTATDHASDARRVVVTGRRPGRWAELIRRLRVHPLVIVLLAVALRPVATAAELRFLVVGALGVVTSFTLGWLLIRVRPLARVL